MQVIKANFIVKNNKIAKKGYNVAFFILNSFLTVGDIETVQILRNYLLPDF